MNQNRRNPNHAAKWLPAVAAAGLLGAVVVAGVALGGGSESAPPTSAESAESAESADVAALQTDVTVTSTAVVETPDTTTPVVKSQLSRNLTSGVAGDDVTQVQQRLTDLGYWPGPVDGVYGPETIKAVWAYEKLMLGVASNAPTGQMTPEMWDGMQDPSAVLRPRRPNSTPDHVEVYLPEQVLAIFHDDKPVMVTHMSSGDGTEWCAEVTISPGEYNNRDGTEPLVRGECGRSITPGGVFNVYRQVEGVRESSLGGMWNPVYFNYGIAIHGALNVPLKPASHGCIRVPLTLDDQMQDLIANGDQVFVFDGVREPEAYGAQKPVFNWIDPDYETTTTTSTTTSTTTTTTTIAASTTVPATTNAPAPATTVATATTTPPTVVAAVTTTTVPPG